MDSRNERRFFDNIDLSSKFIEEMLITGADIYAVEELLFGNPQLPGSLPCVFALPSSYTIWLRHELAEAFD